MRPNGDKSERGVFGETGETSRIGKRRSVSQNAFTNSYLPTVLARGHNNRDVFSVVDGEFPKTTNPTEDTERRIWRTCRILVFFRWRGAREEQCTQFQGGSFEKEGKGPDAEGGWTTRGNLDDSRESGRLEGIWTTRGSSKEAKKKLSP